MKKNTAIIFICHSFLICPSNAWPLGRGFECRVCSSKCHVNLGPPGSWLWAPQGLRSSKYCKLIFVNITVVIGTNLIFLKPFLKGRILRSGQWERGKFDFDRHFAFWPISWKYRTFCLGLSGILFGSSRGSFSKRNCPKRTFPSDFVKLGSEILYLYLSEKMVVCCLVVCLFCLLQLCPG